MSNCSCPVRQPMVRENTFRLAASYHMEGSFWHAKQVDDELAAHVAPMLSDMPVTEVYTPTPIFVLVRFRTNLFVISHSAFALPLPFLCP